MSGLPQGWAETTLGNTISLNYGKSLPATVRDGGRFAVFGSNGVVGHHSEAITSAPAIVVGRKGSFGEVHFSDEPCFPIDTTYYVDSFATLDARFALHLLRHLPLTEMNRASAIPGLNREDAYGLSIALPPLPEQRRIVAKVDGLTARTARARKELDRIPTLTARYKQRLLALAFSEFASKTEVEHLPFSDVVSSAQNGISKRRGDTGRMINVLRLADLTDGHFVGDDPREIMLTVAEEGKYGLEADDLICIRVNGSEKLVGRMLVWEDQLDWAFCDHFIRFKINSMVCLSKYVSYFFASDKVRAQIESSFVSSAGQKTVSQGTLGRILVPVPPLEEQAKIVGRIESAFGWLDRMAANHAAAARLLPKLDAAILGKAFQGKLVPQDPNDEPANVLLDRIKREREAEVKKPKSGHGRKPNGSKAMTEKPLMPRDQLLEDSEKWPAVGLPFEAIAMRNPLPHDALRDALFELLSDSSPILQQRFDADAEVMVIQRVAA